MTQVLPRSILVVEDDELVRELLKNVLHFAGYKPSSACDGEEALHRLASESFDMIISDLHMPKVNGLALLEQVKLLPQHVPFVMLTGQAADEDVKRGLALGAEDYITKPIFAQALLERVAEVFDRSNGAAPTDA